MDEEKPLVSIITPTFNRADFLPLTIRSVLEQTYDNYEMHIVDDGSTDNTAEIVRPFLTDKRIFYHLKGHAGQSAARNYGLQQSRGELICFLDSDDLFLPDKLAIQAGIMKDRADIDVLYGDYEHINERGEIITRDNMVRHSGHIYYELLMENCISMNSTMVRRKCFDDMGGFDETVKFSDDYDLWLRFSTVYTFHYEPCFFTRYRIMENTLSAQKLNRFRSIENILKRSLRENGNLLSRKERDSVWNVFYARRAYYFGSEGRTRDAFLDNLRAIRYRCFTMMPWKGLLKILLLRKTPNTQVR